MDARTFADLVVGIRAGVRPLLMSNWRLPEDVQERRKRLAQLPRVPARRPRGHRERGAFLATHTLHPQLLTAELVLESPVFEHLGVFPDDRLALLAKRDHVRSLAGI